MTTMTPPNHQLKKALAQDESQAKAAIPAYSALPIVMTMLLLSWTAPALAATPPIAWKFCANENSACAFQGTTTVRYGANGKWVAKTATGNINCNNATFGDPILGTRKTCQVPSNVVVVAPPPPRPDWHLASTWGGTVPAPNTAVTIPAGRTVYLDKPVTVKNLTIDGTLRCLNTNLAIDADWIMVHGRFECGTPQQRHTGDLIITLRGAPDAPQVMGMGSKVLGVMGGGVLSLHGQADRKGWVRLNATANKGATSLILDQQTNWRIGDTIFVTASAEDFNQSELRQITGITGNTVRIDSPLTYAHFGQTQTFDNGKGRRWVVETRAEVGLLSRNIVIRGDAQSGATRFGGHVMVMKDSKAYLDGVSFFDMGQEGLVGRYPFHWHFVGDGTGQYVRNSAILNSFNRCVTIHQTDNTRVEDNVCYRHLGHGYFLEDGVEQNNTITGNLGAVGIRPAPGKNILASDIMDQPAAVGPATFWISNPKNIVNGNVAAGSQGSGFWYALDTDTKPRLDGTTTRPASDTYLEFHDNLSHSSPIGYNSCVRGGGVAGWESPDIVIRGFTAYMTTKTGNWPCSLDTQRFENMRLVDSGRAGSTAAFTAPNKMTIVDSLFVANSALAPLNGGKKSRSAYGHYDQGGSIERTHFVGYTAEDNSAIIGFAGGAVKNTSNRMTDVTFSPKQFRMYPSFDLNSSAPTHLFTSFHDDNVGSMTGIPNSVVVPKHPFFAGLSECQDNGPNIQAASNARVCTMRQVKARTLDVQPAQATRFFMFRRDASGAETRHEFVQLPQFAFIQGFTVPNKSFYYGVEFINKPTANYSLILNQGWPGDVITYEYRNIRPGDRPDGFRRVSSLAELRSANDDVYFSQGNSLVLKVKLGGTGTWNSNRSVRIVQ
jgi:hypothetical protein